ncbi:MAG: hypothetical protein F6K36_06910 [Symploca sp. SIO3C6]|uniref:DZANK-type domain-containing protein n=1 Tax=Symploca sp. SIO1C4 TaxID=2607765 RepID=A0A6B3NIX5_9CYAN|nr:hypothetical protein [Symploca sp. SIO3C6]NER30024.1 hypothetical protein [Symploca sp. SIO1C4]NET05496.1 hypothetical protein [Symploca sp. SIO2B6]
MPNCPRCDHTISSNALSCPHCGIVLKAYGHPGITLHQALGEKSLCESCSYHADDTCNFPQRPHAQECTLYHDLSQTRLNFDQIYNHRRSWFASLGLWCQRHPTLLGILILTAVSFLLALMAQFR